MKYPGGHQSTVFVEQVGTVTALFDQWNDCERTVVLYALLKRLPFSNLKFLQLSIEYNIAQNINSSFTPAAITAAAGASNNKQAVPYTNGSNFNKFHLLESNSNNGIFLTKLISVYKTFRPLDLCQPPPPIDVASRVPVAYGIGNVAYKTKEDILHDILTYLPLLKPGNEEAKSAYISLVPIVVADSIKQVVPTELVQQILSYLLIHPAVTSEDRRSLAHWLHHLEEHINSSYIDSATATATAQKLGTRIGSMAAAVVNKVSSSSGLPFAAINEAGPMPLGSCWDEDNGSRSSSCGTKLGSQPLIYPMSSDVPPSIMWHADHQVPKVASQDYVCDDNVIREFRKTIGRNMEGSVVTVAVGPTAKSTSSSVASCKSSVSSASSSSSSTSSISSSGGKTTTLASGKGDKASDSSTVYVVLPTAEQEDHHVSFSKNGTEILDFDCDDDNKSNTQIAFEGPPPPIAHHHHHRLATDGYLAVPHNAENCFCGIRTPSGQCALLMSSNAMKTRRSNSLTTAPVTASYPGGQMASSSSTENLLQLKPRSFSLSIEGHRGSLVSCGSETRLEDLKPAGLMKMGGNNPGMNCIGQWLKSLRLHKYVWLFSNITYEQMLDISEEYLANLSVTKGARHKLVLCIQKLKERRAVLLQMEQKLLAGDTHVVPMLEELTNIVLTPMKPIDPYSKDNIAGLFIKVVEIVGSILISRPIQGPSDEEYVTTFLWILERALHNEAFLGQMNLLKELKFKVSKIKLMFVNKPHYGKSIPAPINKARWTKPNTAIPPPPTSLAMERKNSATSLQSYSSMGTGPELSQLPPPPQIKRLDGKNHFSVALGASAGMCAPPQHQAYSKSSSYPNFSHNLKFPSSHIVHPSIMSQNQSNGHPPMPPHPAEQLSAKNITQPPPIFNGQQQQVPPLAHLGLANTGGLGGGCGNTIYHRHSMNSLMTGNTGSSSAAGSQDTKVSPGGGGQKQQERLENNENIDIGNQCKDKNNICDINSRLEFLCLQMTEQAIN